VTPWQLAAAKNNSLFIDALAALLSPMDADRALLKAVFEHVSGCFTSVLQHIPVRICCVCVFYRRIYAHAPLVASPMSLRSRLDWRRCWALSCWFVLRLIAPFAVFAQKACRLRASVVMSLL
jgi:hypothetical protein